MAPTKPANDLNAMIAADRQRRKNENLAQEIFGKNRRSSAPGAALNNRKSATAVPSLASRIGSPGITKRSISTSTRPRAVAVAASKPPAGNVNAEWTHDLHSLNNPAGKGAPPRGPKATRGNRNDHIQSALHASASSPALNGQFNIVGSSKPVSAISIRGLAGPYTVVVKNLAAGTTAADIESALTPVGGAVLNCRLIAERPKVIAELIFETKEGADNVVDTFNNQNADGNILHVYHKSGPVPASVKLNNTASSSANFSSSTATPRAITPLGPRADTYTDRSDDRPGYGNSDRYAPPRERSRERRRDYDRDDVMDGSYGFEDRMETDDRREDKSRGGGGLYSDTMIGNRGRGNANGRDRGGRGGDPRGYR